MQNFEIDNYTALLPVTCNANCGFCPEKESEKIDKSTWLYNLVDNINRTHHLGYDHISLSGGEPTLDPRLLKATLWCIQQTPVRGVGITTNGQWLESVHRRRMLLELLNSDVGRDVYFINISRHAFDTKENNEIMKVDYKHTLSDISEFRRNLAYVTSFRLNMVITPTTDFSRLFLETKALTGWLRESNISIAFRTDYAFGSGREIPAAILNAFSYYFGDARELGGCPTCATYGPGNGRYNGLVAIKSADFEPTTKDPVIRELVQHMNGVLYYDWTRQTVHDFNDDPVFSNNWLTLEKAAGPLMDYMDPMELADAGKMFTEELARASRAAPRTSSRIDTLGIPANRISSSGSCGGGSCGGKDFSSIVNNCG